MVAGVLLLSLACVTADSDIVTISVRHCAHGEVDDPEFSAYGQDALRCKFRHRGRVVLEILSVDIEAHCARVGRTCGSNFVPPKIIDARGLEVGRLPDNFPGEAAVSYVIRLKRIINGWPEVIHLVGTSQSVSPAPSWKPQRWQRSTGRYSDSAIVLEHKR